MSSNIVAGVDSRSSGAERLSIAQVSQHTGLSIDTLRYYERAGLLPPVARDGAGRRRYGQRDLGWLALIRCLRDTGMPLQLIRTFTGLAAQGDPSLPQRIGILREHDRALAATIAELRGHQRYLRGKLRDYEERLTS